MGQNGPKRAQKGPIGGVSPQKGLFWRGRGGPGGAFYRGGGGYPPKRGQNGPKRAKKGPKGGGYPKRAKKGSRSKKGRFSTFFGQKSPCSRPKKGPHQDSPYFFWANLGAPPGSPPGKGKKGPKSKRDSKGQKSLVGQKRGGPPPGGGPERGGVPPKRGLFGPKMGLFWA
jgi:hypothetical protein